VLRDFHDNRVIYYSGCITKWTSCSREATLHEDNTRPWWIFKWDCSHHWNETPKPCKLERMLPSWICKDLGLRVCRQLGRGSNSTWYDFLIQIHYITHILYAIAAYSVLGSILLPYLSWKLKRFSRLEGICFYSLVITLIGNPLVFFAISQGMNMNFGVSLWLECLSIANHTCT